MNSEDREAENTQDEIDGASDGRSGQSWLLFDPLPRVVVWGEGGGWGVEGGGLRGRRKRALFI
jgi:hypothetical protein